MILFLASMAAKNRERSHSLKKQRLSTKTAILEEDIEDGYIQILIKKEHLEELQSILTVKKTSKNISQGEITSLCGILADCGILSSKEK
jgi:hypothetical protein